MKNAIADMAIYNLPQSSDEQAADTGLLKAERLSGVMENKAVIKYFLIVFDIYHFFGNFTSAK